MALQVAVIPSANWMVMKGGGVSSIRRGMGLKIAEVGLGGIQNQIMKAILL
jgi:hypothetical protein